MARAYLCDFDGTIAPRDVGAALVERFAIGGRDERKRLLGEWREGRIGSRAVTEAEVAWMRVGEAEALAFTRSFDLDPHFSRFVRETQARGHRVAVVSDGFAFYVEDSLNRAGLGDLEWTANRLRFDGERVVAEFEGVGDGCGRCGNCKAVHVRREQQAGFEVVLVGDGLSDRCGARAADQVIARGELLAWCRAQAIAARPFENFSDVAALAHAATGEAR